MADQHNETNGSTACIAKMLGISFAAAQPVRAEEYAQGNQLMDLQVTWAGHAELARTGLEMLVDLAHSAASPLSATITSVAIKDADDEADEPEYIENPSKLYVRMMNPLTTRLSVK